MLTKCEKMSKAQQEGSADSWLLGTSCGSVYTDIHGGKRRGGLSYFFPCASNSHFIWEK